uniref:Lactamase_B domain-containing protein n=1 Tax=Syphacia muris TaxID=451379 RepID=A0A158R5B2_9BILA
MNSVGFVFIFVTLLLIQSDAAATTEQLRQWIVANRRALPTAVEEPDLASTILRIFGFGSDKTTVTTTVTPSSTAVASNNGVKASERDVCPFGADPLILSGEYAYCKPSSVGDCPVGFLCDQSFVLGRSICCQDLRSRPGISFPNRPASVTTVRPPLSWNTVTPTQARWVPYTRMPTRRAPWYIKDRTPWSNSVYNRLTEAPTTKTTTVASTTTPTTTSTTQMTTTTTTEPTTTTTTPTTTTTLPTTTTTTPTTTTSTMPPTTTTQSTTTTTSTTIWSTTSAPRNNVNVSVLQSGNVRNLKDNVLETIGAITLINDNGMHVLVDTGSPSDTERLLQSLSKEGVTLDEINTVVITHGHPGHMGNMNFFGQKPILFHSIEYVGRQAISTELKDRPYRKLSTNIEVWKTPGHTQHDLSVLVHNVAGYGSMAVVGDLIPSEQLISDKIDIMAEEGVWDSAIKRQNANLIVCMADWIIPGHGQPFRVLPQYRQKAGCTRLLAQKHLLNQ